MKTTWFKHDIRSLSDDKLAALVSSYGAEGYGIFWAIIEAMYEADGNALNTLTFKRIARDLGVENSKVIAVAKFAASADCGQLLHEKNGAYQSARVVKSLEKNEEVLQKKRDGIKKRWSQQTPNRDVIDMNKTSTSDVIDMNYMSNTDKIRLDKIRGDKNNITLSNTNVLSSVCGEQFSQLTASNAEQAPSEPIFLVFPSLKGKPYPITESQIKEWEETFPAVDVRQQVRNAKSWLEANPKNMKSNIKSFLNNWLTKEQNRARTSGSDNKIKGTDIEMTFRPNSLSADNFKDDVSFNEIIDRKRSAK